MIKITFYFTYIKKCLKRCMVRSLPTKIVTQVILIILLSFLLVDLIRLNQDVLKKLNILSYGINHFRPNDSIHAEFDAIKKLPKNRKLKQVAMLVIRISKTKLLGNSCPCDRCKNMLNTFAITHGYKVKNVWYSTVNGFEKL